MKCIEFDEQVFIPARKICAVIKDQKDSKVLIIWLDGSQTQTITYKNQEDRDNDYSKITKLLKEM